MVLLHVKRSDEHQFLHDLPIQTTVENATTRIVEISNLMYRIKRLKLEGEELAKYGPRKEPSREGIDTYQGEDVSRLENYNMDPTGRRTGEAATAQGRTVLLDTLNKGNELVHKSQVERRVRLTADMLKDAIDEVRGAVMIAYPMGLPEWDPVRQALEGEEDLAGTSHAGDDLETGATELWFAGKKLLTSNCLSDHLGKNEKTKAVVKLVRKGQGAPAREPVVDESTQKAMMAWYFKKQEEQKKLAEDDGGNSYKSAWANPKSLKNHFAGVGQIRLPH